MQKLPSSVHAPTGGTPPKSIGLRLINLDEVREKLSMSRSTVYRLVAGSDFPPPVKIGTASRWPEHLVDEWLASRIQPQSARRGARM